MSAAPVLFVGRATLDVVYRLDAFPEQDTKTYATEMMAAPGGPALNAAITHALLGGRSVLLSAVGGGPWAAGIREGLRARGVELIDVAAGTAYQAPLTTVLVNAGAGTRTIVNPPQELVPLPMLNGWDEAWGARPAMVLCDGFHLRETLGVIRDCRAEGADVCLDGGSWKPGTAELAPLLAAAICSERFRTEDGGAGTAVLRWFGGVGVPHAAVTRGAGTIVGSERGRRFEVAVRAVQAVDTLGAGDVLHGAFCYFFARSGDFEAALTAAAEVATRSCEGMGIDCWFKS